MFQRILIHLALSPHPTILLSLPYSFPSPISTPLPLSSRLVANLLCIVPSDVPGGGGGGGGCRELVIRVECFQQSLLIAQGVLTAGMWDVGCGVWRSGGGGGGGGGEGWMMKL